MFIIFHLGVGKSMTIEAMAKWAELILLKEDHEVFKPRVLVLAFTGKAASLIGKKYINYFSFSFFIIMAFVLGGITLNSGFDLKFGNKHVPLGDKKLAEFRCALADLKLIIIDEISLVKADMLYQIHRRLCEIFPDCAKFPFAKRSVIAVGDLMQVICIVFYFLFF